MATVAFIRAQLSVTCCQMKERGSGFFTECETEDKVGLCLRFETLKELGVLMCGTRECVLFQECDDTSCSGGSMIDFVKVDMVCCQENVACLTPTSLTDGRILRKFINYFESRGVRVFMEILPKECRCS